MWQFASTIGSVANSTDEVPAPVGWLRALALVGVGGAAGTLLRFGAGELLPLGGNMVTFAVNMAGALLLGFVTARLAGQRPVAQLLLGTGLCGGFTTYSAFAAGTAGLLLTGQLAAAVLLALGTVLLGAGATVLGVWLGGRARRGERTRRGVTDVAGTTEAA